MRTLPRSLSPGAPASRRPSLIFSPREGCFKQTAPDHINAPRPARSPTKLRTYRASPMRNDQRLLTSSPTIKMRTAPPDLHPEFSRSGCFTRCHTATPGASPSGGAPGLSRQGTVRSGRAPFIAQGLRPCLRAGSRNRLATPPFAVSTRGAAARFLRCFSAGRWRQIHACTPRLG